MAQFEQKNMAGALFVNDKGGNDKRPDYRGNCVINGATFAVSGWKRTSQAGKVYLSLAFSEPQQTGAKQTDPIAQTAIKDMGGVVVDDLPF
jgi:uncharacterized protein (DUF736 family)